MAEATSIHTQGAGVLQLHKGSGMASYVCYPSNPEVKLHTHKLAGFIKLIDLENAEEFLTRTIDLAFQNEVEVNGMTLVECIVAADKLVKETPTTGTAIESDERFAALLTRVAPSEDPQQLLERLKKLVEERGAGAVKCLQKLAEKNGRDKAGYIRLRVMANRKKVA